MKEVNLTSQEYKTLRSGLLKYLMLIWYPVALFVTASFDKEISVKEAVMYFMCTMLWVVLELKDNK